MRVVLEVLITFVILGAIFAPMCLMSLSKVTYRYTTENCPAKGTVAANYTLFTKALFTYRGETETAAGFTRCSGCGFVGSPGMSTDQLHVGWMPHP